MLLRPPTVADGAAMWELSRGAVDTNSPYAYLMLCHYFTGTCAIAEIDGAPAAFVTGFCAPDDPETLFIWQIVVGRGGRGRGLGSRLLDHLTDRPEIEPVRFLEATVTPGNEPSKSLFRSFAARRGAPLEETPLFTAADFPTDAGDHEAEVRFRIGPW